MLIIIAISLLFIYIYLGFRKPAIALVTSPFVAGTIIFIGTTGENEAAVVIAPGIFIAAICAILLSKPKPDSGKWPKIFAQGILIFFVVILITATMSTLGPFGYSSIGLFALIIGSIVAYCITSRHVTNAYVFSTIGTSMRQNLPLPMALESAAGDRQDKRSLILRRIKKWLIQGYPLSESIRRGYPGCPGYAVAMIAAAERINQLPLAIQAIEADTFTRADERRKIRPVHPVYPVILLAFTFILLFAFMMFVMPTYVSAVDEIISRVRYPFATRVILKIMSFIVSPYGWLFGLVLALIVLWGFPFSIYIKFRPRRPEEPYLISRMGDFVKWHLPVLHNFEKNYSLVQVVELLRLSLNAGCTVNDAIKNTLSLDVNNCFRKRLRRWLQKVERGDNIAAATRKCRLGSPLAWAFDEKVNQGNTLTILETLESFYRSNYSYFVNLTRFIMWPCLILVTGAIIGFIIFAIFSPIILIITILSDMTIP